MCFYGEAAHSPSMALVSSVLLDVLLILDISPGMKYCSYLIISSLQQSVDKRSGIPKS